MEGLIYEGAYNRNKKAVSKRAIAVLIEIRFSLARFFYYSLKTSK